MKDADLRVRVDSGVIEGIWEFGDSVRAFKGVPYARPPLGRLRWRAPELAEAWDGVRRTNSFGPRCIQFPRLKGSLLYFPPEPESEDCLYLNIWTPAKAADERLPVMVWFHGGAWFSGSGSQPLFYGGKLASKGAVVVTVNYRLGRLGFLAHPGLTRESGKRCSGNYGIMDQIASLEWVQRNIAAFGGSPDCVTVFGQSAGALAASLLMASRHATGLIHRVIGQSGAGFGALVPSTGAGDSMQPLDEAEKLGAEFVRNLGARSIDELRTRAAQDIQLAPKSGRLSDRALDAPLLPPRGWGALDTGYPIVDGVVVPDMIAAAFSRGEQNDVPLLTGSTAHERGTAVQPPDSLEEYVRDWRTYLGEWLDDFLKVYKAGSIAEAKETGGRAVGDKLFTWQNWTWVRSQAKTGKAKVFYYRFARPAPFPPGVTYSDNPAGEPWTLHGAEIPYVFGSFAARDWAWQPADHALAEVMSSYWINFAKNGDPNGARLPNWPEFDLDNPAVLTIKSSDEIQSGPIPQRDRLDFWDRFYGSRPRVMADLAARAQGALPMAHGPRP